MREKKTKGKQRINIKKIEKDEDRLVTFSKRRNGIHTKLSELSILYGPDVCFLIFSGAGKPYTFDNPSFDTVAQRFLNGEASSSSSSSSSSLLSIVNAHRKMKVDELCKKYNSVVEISDQEEAILKAREAAVQADVPVADNAWWKVDPEEVKEDEDAKHLLVKYEELYAKLSEVAEARNSEGNVASTSRATGNRNG